MQKLAQSSREMWPQPPPLPVGALVYYVRDTIRPLSLKIYIFQNT